MGLIRELVFLFVSKERAAAMEAESRRWMFRCPSCAHEVSAWDLGGLRYGATSKGKRTYLRCGGCRARGWHVVYLREAPAAPEAKG